MAQSEEPDVPGDTEHDPSKKARTADTEEASTTPDIEGQDVGSGSGEDPDNGQTLDDLPEAPFQTPEVFFEELREELRNWPYAIHQIDDTLDISLIEGRGRQLLFQAINSRSLTAFVGSGIAAAYGRPNWIEWENAQLRLVNGVAEAFDDLAGALIRTLSFIEFVTRTSNYRTGKIPDNELLKEADYLVDALNDKNGARDQLIKIWNDLNEDSHPNIKRKRSVDKTDDSEKLFSYELRNTSRWASSKLREVRYARREVEKLRQTFRMARSDIGSFPGSERSTFVFEIAKQLQTMVRSYDSLVFCPKKAIESAAELDNELKKLRIQEEPHDVGHALIYLFGSSGNLPETSMRHSLKAIGENGKAQFPVALDHGSPAGGLSAAIANFIKVTRSPEAKLPFSDYVKALTIDECVHAEQILLTACRSRRIMGRESGPGSHEDACNNEGQKKLDELQASLGLYDREALKRKPDGLRENSERYRVLQPFTFANAQRLCEHLHKKMDSKHWKAIANVLIGDIEAHRKRITTHPQRKSAKRSGLVTPTKRFLVGALLAQLERPWEALYFKESQSKGNKTEHKKSKEEGSEEGGARVEESSTSHFQVDMREGPSRDHFSNRGSIIEPALDPLARVARDIEVTRFITTNYDFEIERFFHDAGYMVPDQVFGSDPTTRREQREGHTTRRVHIDGIGGVFSDQSFNRHAAGDLVRFATGDDGSSASVFHLHGSAHRDVSRIIVTERDYMDMYLREDGTREMADEGIRMAFSSAPVLFIGLGMTEPDVLRPFRQFMSNNERKSMQSSIVLLSGEKNYEARAKLAAGLYLRYGVHTVYFGGAVIKIKRGTESVRRPVDWLHRIWALVGGLSEIVSARLKKEPEAPDENGFLAKLEPGCETKHGVILHLARAVGPLGDDLGDGYGETEPKGIETLELLFGIDPEQSFKSTSDSREKDEKVAEKRIDALLKQIEENGLARCSFTSIRPGRSQEAAYARRRFHEDDIPGEPFVGSLRKVLTQIVQLTLADNCAPNPASDNDGCVRRELRARMMLLDGLKGALLTATLNAALEGIFRGWREWWKHWKRSPPHRLPHFELEEVPEGKSNSETDTSATVKDTTGKADADGALATQTPSEAKPSRAVDSREGVAEKEGEPFDAGYIMPARYWRHRVLSDITDLRRAQKVLCWENPSVLDFRTMTGVAGYDGFLTAVNSQVSNEDVKRLGRGRRVYTIAAERGVGKGCTFSMMGTRLGLTAYIRAAWPRGKVYTPSYHASRSAAGAGSGLSEPNRALAQTEQNPETCEAFFISALFINLSFSTEIASIYDMLAKALFDARIAVNWIREKVNHRPRKEDPSKDRGRRISTDAERRQFFEELRRDIDQLLRRAADKKPEATALIAETANTKPIDDGADSGAMNGAGLQVTPEQFVDQAFETGRADGKERDSAVAWAETSPRVEALGDLVRRFEESCRAAREELRSRTGGPLLLPRLMIAINGADLLYDANGRAKNSEIGDILSYLTSKDAEGLSIDLVFLGDERRLGEPWRSPVVSGAGSGRIGSGERSTDLGTTDEEAYSSSLGRHSDRYRPDLQAIAIVDPHLDARARSHVDNRKVLSKFDFSAEDAAHDRKISDGCNFIHFLRTVRPTDFLVDCFPLLASGLFLHDCIDRRLEDHIEGAPTDENLIASKIPMRMNGLDQLREQLDLAWGEHEPPDPLKNLQSLFDKRDEEVLKQIPRFAMRHAGIQDKTLQSTCEKELVKRGRDILKERYERDPSTSTESWSHVRRVLGSNRYSLTILLAAAQRLLLSADTLAEGGKMAEGFIYRAVDAIRNAGIDEREHSVLESVFAIYRDLHVNGDPENDFVLHQRLIRCIAVIGAPVSADVLVRVPQIRDYFETLGEEDLLSRRRRVSRALYTLTRRGLCFRLMAHWSVASREDNNGSHWPPRNEFRFALHRIAQQYCIHHLGNRTTEPVSANTFAPSLYASMPSQLPRLSYESYCFMRDLLVALSQYPDIPHKEARGEPFVFATPHTATRVQALRAALCLARSSFSIAVVSRFDDYHEVEPNGPTLKRGHFESYKVRLRWIIRKAFHLLPPQETSREAHHSDRDKYYNPARENDQINALYRDEIVWLYNEVGLTCLVQGNLRDALALLHQSIEFNREIEGSDPGGRQHNRIALNLAKVQIERGRLSSARRRLELIRDTERSQRGVIWHLAHGFLGLIHHLAGSPGLAEDHYQETIRFARETGDMRAEAIFLNHLARLQGLTDTKLAKASLTLAKLRAEIGGHEDIRHHITVSEVRILTRAGQEGEIGADDVRSRLEEVTRYARFMEVPALECEAARTRAEYLIRQGETRSAGSLLVKAMAIARRNGLMLRLNGSMTSYAITLRNRNRGLAADRMLRSSLRLAKKIPYNTEIDRVQGLLGARTE